MNFTAQDVKALREKTGCGMMDCKKALVECDGNMDAAIDYLREQGLAKQAKKADRIAAEGIAFAATSQDGKIGAIVEVNSETDFVAKNVDFQNFVQTVAQTVIDSNPADLEALTATKASGSSNTIAELLQEKVLTIGENLKVRRFVRYEGNCVAYVHAGGKIAVLVNFETGLGTNPEFIAYGKDVAMQIAALNTQFVRKEDVPAETIEHEKKIMTELVLNEGKPAQIAEKIVMGKIGKYYKENCLLDQEFVKDNSMNIRQYSDKVAKELGGKIEILAFTRFEKGEGIEKRQDDFAAEVAAAVKG
ncbi:MAG: translation elongation factor Ts [Oscillospiraceae bacterium]|jgi:elongation factor Ts|nr:translation elongation factor Ts [Oscillospiraceae bacterium]